MTLHIARALTAVARLYAGHRRGRPLRGSAGGLAGDRASRGTCGSENGDAPFYPHKTCTSRTRPDEEDPGMTRRSPPRKVTYFAPVPPRLARNTILVSTFAVGRRFRCTMRVDCGQIDPGTVIQPPLGEWQPHIPGRLDEEELADWQAGRNPIYQLAALTVGARLAVADA